MAPCQDGLQHREEDLGFIFFVKHLGHLLLTLLSKYFQKILTMSKIIKFSILFIYINFNKISIHAFMCSCFD